MPGFRTSEFPPPALRIAASATACALLMAGLVAVAPPSSAGSSALAAYAYAAGNELCILGFDAPGPSQVLANRFVASTNGRLLSVTVATDDPAPTVGIWSDAGDTPGSLLFSSEGNAIDTQLPPLAFNTLRTPLWSEAWFNTPSYFATAWRTFALSPRESATSLVAGHPYWLSVKTTTNSQVEVETCGPLPESNPLMMWRASEPAWQPVAFDAGDGSSLEFRTALAGSIQVQASPQEIASTVGMPVLSTTRFTTPWLDTTYAVEPALPSGLTLDAMTGEVEGTPTSVQPMTEYIITGTGTSHVHGGPDDEHSSATSILSISVTDSLPAPQPPPPPVVPTPTDAPSLAPTAADTPTATPAATPQPNPQATPIPRMEPLVIPTPSTVLPADMYGWTPEQVSTINPADFAHVPPDVIGAISPEQAAVMSPEQISNIRPLGAAELQPVTVSAMDSAQLAGLRPSAVGSLNPLVICAPVKEHCVLGENGLTSAQLAAFRPQAFAQMQPDQFTVIRPAQVAELTIAAMNQIRAAGAAALQPRTVAALEPELLAAMRATAVGALAPQAIALLTPQQLGAVRPQGIARLSRTAVGQIQPAALAGMSAAQLTALTPAQVSVLTRRQLAALSPAQRRLL